VELEDLADVRMDELRAEAGFILEHGDELVVVAQMREQRLDHQELLEPGDPPLPGQIDFPHPAAGEALQELVAAEGGVHEATPEVWRGTLAHAPGARTSASPRGSERGKLAFHGDSRGQDGGPGSGGR